MITQSTLPVILLTFLAVLAPGRARLVLLGGLLTLTDAALITSPLPFGVPWFAFAVLLVFGFSIHPVHIVRAAFVRHALFPYAVGIANLVAILGVLTLWTGKIVVMPNFSYFQPAAAVTIDFFRPHINQLVYLILGIGAALWIIAFARARGWLETFERVEAVLCGFVLISVSIALWEWVSFQTGVFYPKDFFHSDTTTLAFGQQISGVSRVQGPFSEPSDLGGSVGLSCAVLMANLGVGRLGGLRMFAIPLALFVLFISTSTTGYFMIALNVGVALVATFSAPVLLVARGVVRVRDIVRTGRLLLMLLVGTAAILWAANYFLEQLGYSRVLQETLFGKSRSESFFSRQFADRLGVQAFLQTFGMGVGLGGHVSSSGYSSVLGTIGILGACAIWAPMLAALFSPLAPIGRVGAGRGPKEVRALVLSRLALAAAAGAMLAGMMFSMSQLNSAYFWLIYACCVVVAADAFGGGNAPARWATPIPSAAPR